MRLKKLHLQGYKTFANKTEFVFESGVTAIVGPNGSGKSNVADAIRWVMGEQAYSHLRGKKTEDMIFSGSSERSRMGMAEATITLDNTDNWLPIEFDEVMIGRRAYRSGENEYYLNGTKVRLKDVQELLDRSGLGRRTHTVIGQGLIDQALALRPEDRRELFEEAAGITVYRQKRRRSLEQLDKTLDNLTRVRDIISEIRPRLRQLERQAERARQYEEIGDELRDLLLVWYGYNWHLALRRLVDAQSAVTHWQQVIDRSEERIEAYNEQTADLRARQTELRSGLSEWRRQLGVQESQRGTVLREEAVGQERLRALEAEQKRLQDELELLQQRRQGAQARLEEATAVFAGLQEQGQEHAQHVTQAEQALARQEQERHQIEQELAGHRRQHLDMSSRISDRNNRIAQVKERQKAVEAERNTDFEAAATAATEAVAQETQFEAISDQMQDLGRQMDALRQEHVATEARRQEHIQQRTQLEQQQSEFLAQLRALRARFELLDRLRAEGEGLFAGVRSVLQAARENTLDGVLGPIASLIDVPSEYEQAIEVALGGRIQDVVVATWDDAERAISYLKDTRGGRATFLPLDNVRPQSRQEAPSSAGVLGWAADLIGYDAEVAPAVELLLGQVLVVKDLAAARQASRSHNRPRIVTLEGDYVHPGGSVSGGSQNQRQQGGMLAREREWRSLPGQIEAVEEERITLQQKIEHTNQVVAALDAQLTRLVEKASALGQNEREGVAELNRLQSAIDRLRQREAWHKERAAKLEQELQKLARQQAGLRQESGEFSARQAEITNRIELLEESLETLSTAGLMQAVAQARARLEAAEETRRSQQALVENHRTTVRQIESEINQRQRQTEALQAESAELRTRIETLVQNVQVIERDLAELRSQMQPAEKELEQLDQGWNQHEEMGESLRARLHQEELQLNQAQLTKQRAEDHLAHLRSQVEHDFGLVTMHTEGGMVAQEPLPFDQIVTTLPHVESLPLEAESEIRRLKSVISRLGAVNPEAQSEFVITKERFDFLSQQSEDLEEAANHLKQVIAELDELMDQEFRRTFEAVAKAFTGYFTRLFGGGAAKLVLTDSEDVTATGVEIIARPPGKRADSLSMLSGGERALTAAALVFSILSVSPLPFCVLDEVDAALDESNIGRVRDALLELSDQAQVIIITHNRGTIEAANTIYGITMGSDSVSQALSLKLEGEKLLAA
ncbi:MAG: chromosome segregation protein SMC [Caldilineales bacterium]|nr:chromosome segregation protein SMC [Caldilineales bacterium]